MKKLSILSICLCGSLILLASGCNSFSDVNLSPTVEDVLTSKEYSAFAKRIEAIEPPYRVQDSWVTYSSHREQSEKLVKVGFRGIPVLIDMLVQAEVEDGWHEDDFLQSGIYAILRIDCYNTDAMTDFDYRADSPTYIETLANIYKNSKTHIPDIIASDKVLDEKLETLRPYGVLALPYVVNELKKGNDEYEEFFIAIGLHLSSDEYYDYLKCSYAEIKSSKEDVNADIFLSRGKNFNPLKWLNENSEDLRIAFAALEKLS